MVRQKRAAWNMFRYCIDWAPAAGGPRRGPDRPFPALKPNPRSADQERMPTDPIIIVLVNGSLALAAFFEFLF